ncbi:MAG: YggT family protein [Rhodocyclaceae bacterium]|nr:YggT family protein [Rhodocyclaceae bacterium]
MAVTDWMVLPARRYIPAFRGYDTATLMLALGWQFINMGVATAVTIFGIGLGPTLLLGLLLLALLETIKVSLYLVMAVVLISAIFSSGQSTRADGPASSDRISQPGWPFQRLIPPVGEVDLSPGADCVGASGADAAGRHTLRGAAALDRLTPTQCPGCAAMATRWC